MSELIGCIGCKYADWDADGCTCKISGLLVPDSRKGCEQRKPKVELKPCPFCGSEGLSGKKYRYRYPDLFTCVCIKCGAMCGFSKTLEEAVERWNRRADNE